MANDLNRSVKIYIDGSAAQASIESLRATVARLEAELEGLDQSEQGWMQRSKTLTREIESKNKSIANYERQLRETERVLSELSGATYNELIAVQRRLRKELQGLQQGTEEYNRTLEQYRRVSRQVAAAQQAMRVELESHGSVVARVADGFNRYAGVVAGFIASVAGMAFTIRESVEAFAEMEEAESQVAKYTGMTTEEVKKLNEAFKQMDTRSSREELNRLAGEAGKLGLTGVEDVKAFVEAADMINVALGEDLGKEAVNQIGKLAQMFGDESRTLKENMIAVGSAINQVAQSSSASEPYLVSFAARMGGVGKQAGMSVTDIMGFASALDQNMLRSEMASTALSGLVLRIYQEPAKFAALAGKDVEEFTRLVETDANEAVMQFLESLNGLGGMADLAPVLKEMHLSGSEAASVVSTLATNVALVRQEQENANQAFTEGTSIVNEFNIQNNTVQARLEKARARFTEVRVELGERMLPVMSSLISTTSLTVKGLLVLIETVDKHKAVLVSATLTVAAATVAYNAHTLATKAVEVATKAAAAAQRLFNAALKGNPVGAVIAVVGTLATVLTAYLTKVREANRLQREMNEELLRERENLDYLFGSLEKAGDGTQRRKDLIDEINSRYGSYLGHLLTERSTLDEIRQAYDRVNQAMEQSIVMKYRNQERDETISASVKDQQGYLDDLRSSFVELTGSERSAGQFLQDLRQMAKESSRNGVAMNQDIQRAYATLSKEFLGGKELTKGMKDDIADYMNAVLRLDSALSDIEKKYEAWQLPSPETAAGGELPEITVTARNLGASPAPVSGTGGGAATTVTTRDLITRLEEERETVVSQQERLNKTVLASYEKLLYERQMTRQEYDIRVAAQTSGNAEKLVEIEKTYHERLRALDVEDGEAKEQAVKKAWERVLDAGDTARVKEMEAEQTYRQHVEQLRAMLPTAPPSELDALKAEYDARLELLKAYYEASRELADAYGQDETELERTYTETREGITREYEEKRREVVERQRKESEETARKTLNTFQQMQALQGNSVSQSVTGMINAFGDLQKAVDSMDFSGVTQSLNALFNAVTGSLSSAFSSFREAEVNAVEARYNAEIEAAGENEEAVERLEYEKAVKKLEIEKKYADSEFAVRASEIIANTALAVMQAYAQLGPIAGSVAAALMTATGAVQLAVANAEREKVKNQTLEGGGSTGSGTKTRVASSTVSQYAGGRYDVVGAEDGKTYRGVPYIGPAPTGVVEHPALISEDGAELIVNSADLRTLRRHVNYSLVVEAINDSRRGVTRQHAAGSYGTLTGEEGASGGTRTQPIQSPALDARVLERFVRAVDRLTVEGVKADLVYTELERKQKQRERARRIGGK